MIEISKPRLTTVAIALLLGCSVFLSYWPVRNHEFINYDDPDYMTHNAHVLNGLSRDNIVWAFQSTFSSNWHPLTWLSLMAGCELYGDSSAGHHLTNVFLHALNVVLLFCLLKRMTRALWPSALVASLFGLHPLHVESVAWVAERKDVLSLFFGLLATGCYVRYAELRGKSEHTAPPKPRKRFTNYFWAWIFFALGLLSKPTVVTLPFVWLLLDFWPLSRIPAVSTIRTIDIHWKGIFPRLLKEKIPFFILSAALCIVTYCVQKLGGAVLSMADVGIGPRIENIIVSYGIYLWKTIWPVSLAVLYPRGSDRPFWQFAVATVALITFAVLAFQWARRRPYFLVGYLWFLGTLVPMIGIVQIGEHALTDRYSYLPLVGVFIAFAWTAFEIANRSRRSYVLISVLSIVSLVFCVALTRMQLRYWRTSQTLFAHAIEVTHENPVAENYLAMAFAEKGDEQQATVHFSQALRLRPTYADAANNFGFALSSFGKTNDAIVQYRHVLEYNPTHHHALNNLALALAAKGEYREAAEKFSEIVRYYPDDVDARYNLSNALIGLGRFPEAETEISELLRRNPSDADAHKALALVLNRLNRKQEAANHFAEALRLNPADSESKSNLHQLKNVTP